jgi:hypothetical protein
MAVRQIKSNQIGLVESGWSICQSANLNHLASLDSANAAPPFRWASLRATAAQLSKDFSSLELALGHLIRDSGPSDDRSQSLGSDPVGGPYRRSGHF